MSINLELFFVIRIVIIYICFCTFMRAIKLVTEDKLCVPHEEWWNLGKTDSSVLAIVLIFGVSSTNLHTK